MKWEIDSELFDRMKSVNDTEMKRLSDALEDAEKNRGESEVRDIMLEKAEYLSKIGDKVSIGCLFSHFIYCGCTDLIILNVDIILNHRKLA